MEVDISPVVAVAHAPRIETLQAGLAAVGALMTVLAGDGKRDKGLMSRTVEGRQHVQTCNRGRPTRRRVW